jgi:hypothetical protein
MSKLKLFGLALASVALLSLAGCKNNKNADQASNSNNSDTMSTYDPYADTEYTGSTADSDYGTTTADQSTTDTKTEPEPVMTEDKEGKCSRSFKSFITAFEASNKCEAIWGEKFAAQFKNKKIGGVFGKVENEYNGKVTMRHELRWFCSDDKADGADIPADKLLPVSNGATSSAMIPDDIVNNGNEADEVIPF